MKNILIPVMLLIFSFNMNAQKPETIKSIAKVYKPHEWYLNQAELWWSEIQKDKKNENAWYNYFMANRMASFEFNNQGDSTKKFYEETKFLMNTDTIVKLTQKFIPNTFTSNYIIWRNHGTSPEDFAHLEKAYSINPDFYGINNEMISYYETQYDLNKRKEYNLKWFEKNELSSGILAFNYNVMMSIKPNGVLITYGDNDTFPIWLLQDVFNIRPDITVLNVYLLDIESYRSKIFNKLRIPDNKKYSSNSNPDSQKELISHIIKNKPADLPLYISTPAWKQLEENEKDLYLVGLVLEYSKENIDNIALLKNNFENLYTLDYLKNQFSYDISKEVVQRMNVNYIPGIIKLYQHYKLSGENEKAEKIKQLGLTIAEKGGEDWKIKAEEALR